MYGLILSISILISALVAEKIVEKQKMDKEVFWGLVFWGVLTGVIGARIWHVIDQLTFYREFPLLIPMISTGGMGIPGGIIGGALGAFIYLKIILKIVRKRKRSDKNHSEDKNESIGKWLDIGALVLPLGQALGRLGNVVNRELLPFAYYEIAADLILLFLLWPLYWILYRSKLKMKDGALFVTYLIGYTIIRILLQPLR